MTIDSLDNDYPSLNDFYEWHKNEACKNLYLSIDAPLSKLPRVIIHLIGAGLLCFPGVNRVVYAAEKRLYPNNQIYPKKIKDQNIPDEKKNHLKGLKISDEKKNILKNLESKLRESIIGQDAAIKKVSRAIKTSLIKLNPQRPDGVFLFVGPTGVGKTELAQAIAKQCSDGVIRRFDMSEYKYEGDINKLIGCASGFVGYQDGGTLTKALIKDPTSVILLDELEKANPQVLDVLLQIFDAGRITSSLQKTVDCSKAIFIMTSNLGSMAAATSSKDEREGIYKIALQRGLKPEFINRIDQILYFNPIDDKEDFRNIVLLKMDKYKSEIERQLSLNKDTILWTEDVIDFFAREGISPEYGVRPLERLIQTTLGDLIVNAILSNQTNEGHIKFKVQDDQIVIEQLDLTP